MKSTLIILWKDYCLSWHSNTFAAWYEESTHWKSPWYWERLKAGGAGSDRGWDGWMASLTQWTWVWANSGREWRTGKLSVLQFIELQRVGHDWATATMDKQIYAICFKFPNSKFTMWDFLSQLYFHKQIRILH